jgi:hypothetical protein
VSPRLGCALFNKALNCCHSVEALITAYYRGREQDAQSPPLATDGALPFYALYHQVQD